MVSVGSYPYLLIGVKKTNIPFLTGETRPIFRLSNVVGSSPGSTGTRLHTELLFRDFLRCFTKTERACDGGFGGFFFRLMVVGRFVGCWLVCWLLDVSVCVCVCVGS